MEGRWTALAPCAPNLGPAGKAAPLPRGGFAIVSHSDAGKTTLTVNLLLGAILRRRRGQGARRSPARALRLEGDRARAWDLSVELGDELRARAPRLRPFINKIDREARDPFELLLGRRPGR